MNPDHILTFHTVRVSYWTWDGIRELDVSVRGYGLTDDERRKAEAEALDIFRRKAPRVMYPEDVTSRIVHTRRIQESARALDDIDATTGH